uniref:Serine/threonine-protein kinase 11-interacting protein n=1 Tax=Sphenodon punctatus TaxID=8508 RepID=A0A8D0G9K5_SPHPU
VLDGTSTLTLLTSTLQHLTRVFEQHLVIRNQNHGFVALPSHPADNSTILQAQFLFDILQKTLSLKLVHVPSCALASAVKISPFKSLRRLELKSVPLHCLRGLRFVYSQLEALTCSKCVGTLEEIISACGGDLSSALPWLELQTVNFSYNSITALDDSLQLLNALKVLDLSHNKLQDCGRYLVTLMELEYLNLAYNFLHTVPDLGLHGKSKLVTLILCSNELDSISGVEQLPSLQHLDIAYNMLLEHTHLVPLSMLHNLRQLRLEGNPLWFHQNHRPATIAHLSPRAASSNQRGDHSGPSLLSLVLQHLPKSSGQMIVQLFRAPTLERGQLDRSALDSSCAADLSDSQSPGESTATRLPQKKSKGKVKVRRASISEPSDTEHESRHSLPLSTGMVQKHQAEMEALDSFRDRFGADWLQYKRHLETQEQGGPVLSFVHAAAKAPGSSNGTDLPSESTLHDQETPCGSVMEAVPTHDLLGEEKVLESALGEVLEEGPRTAREEEEEEKPEVDLCQPVLVSQIEGHGDPEPDWIFLRVTARHVLEVELKAASILHRLEVRSLQKVETSEMVWRREDLERVFPVLTLHFSYIRKDRQKRRYVVLDNHPELCVQSILQVLTPVLEENLQRSRGQTEGAPKLQCLKCKQEFAGRLALWPRGPCSAEGSLETAALPEEDNAAAAAGQPVMCPSCSSDHVVVLPLPAQDCLPPAESREAAGGKFYIGGEDSSEAEISSSTRTQELSGDQGSAVHSSSHSSDGGDASRKELGAKSRYSSLSCTDTNGCGSLMGSYRYGASRGPTPSQLSLCSEPEEHWNLSPPTNGLLDMRDFRCVDHRLKLYLDMEVFEENVEEFQCFLKLRTSLPPCCVAVVKWGRPGEFLAILVASDLRFHMLEVTGEIRGQPSNWLQKSDCHCLSDLSHLEVGLCHQSLHVAFENPPASYTLLLRNQNLCKKFLQCLSCKRGALLWGLCLARRVRAELRQDWLCIVSRVGAAGALGSECFQPIGVSLSWAVPATTPIPTPLQVLKVESVWHLRTECPELLAELVEWLRVPWEEMFSIPLTRTMLEVLE